MGPVVAGALSQVSDDCRGFSPPGVLALTHRDADGQGLTRRGFIEAPLAEWLPPMRNSDEASVTDKTAHAAHKLTGRATRPFAPCTRGRRLFSSDHG